MADWKQITARIRRARSGKDPSGQLTNLFSKTRDAMVAFELARYFESKGNTVDAGRWYLTAAERFRRSDWKTKAQENATRLGATEPAEIPAPTPRSTETQKAAPETAELSESIPQADSLHAESSSGTLAPEEAAQETTHIPSAAAADSNHHRRGRRGGREQRSGRRSSSSASSRERVSAQSPPRRSQEEEAPVSSPVARKAEAVPEAPLQAGLRSRFGDPGLSSRLTQLEMNFRRLLACPPCSLEDAEKAPAGPGVWVLTDSDLSTYYYVEPCQTLRVAIPHLLRSNASRRGGESIKPRLAEHLGIPETRVAKYLSDHCVVRWLQMDEGASHFAHFLIAVLHPALNE
jgi:hypothetical protein